MLRIVPHTVPRVGRSYEHFPDGFDLHLPIRTHETCRPQFFVQVPFGVFDMLDHIGVESGAENVRAPIGLVVGRALRMSVEAVRVEKVRASTSLAQPQSIWTPHPKHSNGRLGTRTNAPVPGAACIE